tara:strand:+ start:150 stop:356 length:207 start_codon:yes stop_codon:yes gene_type:complete
MLINHSDRFYESYKIYYNETKNLIIKLFIKFKKNSATIGEISIPILKDNVNSLIGLKIGSVILYNNKK